MDHVLCPECDVFLPGDAVACTRCGAALEPERKFKGPPVDCFYCGGDLKKRSEANSEGPGCILAIVGVVLLPALIGIPILLYGLHHMSKRQGIWLCRDCNAKFPREIKWHEFT